MRRMTYFVMALAMVLGLAQCKKEQPLEPTNEGNGVRITLNVENGSNSGARANVNPPHVTFVSGDQILVGYNGAYVGTLTHNGEHFAGSIDATVSGSQKLYFYFVGNKNKTGASISVGAESYTVDISDQTTELPVLSFSASIEDFTGAGSYSASLHNQCALVKFPLANAAGSVLVGGMYKEATISFASPGITKTGTPGQIRLFSKTDTEKWAILLPQDLVDDAAVTIGNQSGLTVDVPAIMAGDYIIDIEEIANTSSVIDLSTLIGNYTAKDGDILTGKLYGTSQPYKIAIADGATVTLDKVAIYGENRSNYSWAGITCEGDATIILKDGTENEVIGFYMTYPGIYVAPSKTLTIQGSGSLNASPNHNNGTAAGIGGGRNLNCGNIVIKGGEIHAAGLNGCAGIGSGLDAACESIEISGGNIQVIGGSAAAGIGSGRQGTCGNITITDGVTQVSVIKGSGAYDCIGRGQSGTCGTITIGGTVYWNDNAYQNGGDSYFQQSTLTYQP